MLEPVSTQRVRSIQLVTYPDRTDAVVAATDRIQARITAATDPERSVVLGLATGRTPTGIYRELVRRHVGGELTFQRVSTFNLDEYFPIPLDHPASFHRFMHRELFDRVDLPKGRRHVPNGSLDEASIEAHCETYERAIAAAGGIDLQLLGLGRNGHIGFNEPGSPAKSRTRLVELDPITRRDNAGPFGSEAAVPMRAITMGIQTILEAREILLLAFGRQKAAILRRALLGPSTPRVPASFLQRHPAVTVICDREASREFPHSSTSAEKSDSIAPKRAPDRP